MKLFFLISPGAIFLLTLVANAQTHEEKFDTVVSDFLKGYFQANPISATSIGMHDYDNQLDDIGPAAIDAELNRLIIFRKKLMDIDLKDLPRNKRIDHQILSENIDEAIFGLRDVREFEWNPMTYTIALGNSFASLLYQEFAPLEQRMKNAVERAKQVPRFLEQAKANLKNPPKMHVETAIKQNMGNISMIKNELATAGKTLSPELQSDIQAASGAAITALEDFGKWLEHDLMPRASKDTRLGKELFDKKLAYALKTSLTPGEILKRARAEKDRKSVV